MTRDEAIARLRELASEALEVAKGVEGIGMVDFTVMTNEHQEEFRDLEDDDRDALAWVRNHGGIDYVKREWRSRVPYDKHERARQRLLGHIAECETALGRRNQRIEELGHRVGDLTRENAELRRRAMPEGCEWPRYDSGEPVLVGSVAEFGSDDSMTVMGIELTNGGFVLRGRNGGIERPCQVGYKCGERVKRPAVLAADGEPLEVGQTVWSVNDGREYKVVTVESPVQFDMTSIKVDDGKAACGVWIRPDNLTHQRPVLDADGVPIKKGDTVYLLPGEWCDEWPCCGFHGGEELVVFADGEADHMPGGVQCREKGTGHRYTCYPQPSQLSHTKPEIDSWERIEEDAKKEACAYFGVENGGYGCSECPVKQWEESCDEVKSSDLVRRCRALAERERGE